jgi:predicted glycosyltransferase
LTESKAVAKRIWIDLDNSPHVPFFAPIIKELEARGYSVLLTARDAFQVCELADRFQFNYRRVGRHYGKNKALKVLGTSYRALQLLLIAARARPDLALSHLSRSQILASRLLGIPSLAIGDYEFAGRPVLKPTWMMVPDVIPASQVYYGARGVVSYRGIKEDVYVPTFKPDPSIRTRLALNGSQVVVTVRPPASEAHYHCPESDALFAATMEFLRREPDVKVVLVPRNARQGASVRGSWPGMFSAGKVMIPEHAEDGLNLIWHSDLVISGGGTMNREAAALGVPVYSIFRGKIGAVDRYLAQTGRLTLVENEQDISQKVLVRRRKINGVAPYAAGLALSDVVNEIVKVVESKGREA